MAYPSPPDRRPAGEQQLAVLLLPHALEAFERRELAEDLLRAEGVVAAEPPRVSYETLRRLPELVGEALAARQGRRLARALRKRGHPRVVVVFDPLQYPLARALMVEAGDPVDLWYGYAQRADAAPSLRPALRDRLVLLHEQAAQRSVLTFVASEELARLERERGRRPLVLGPAHGEDAREAGAPLWERLAQAGVDVRISRP